MNSIKELLENSELYRIFGRVTNPSEISLFLKKFPFDDLSTQYVNRLMTTEELCEYKYINEIQVINKNNEPIKPDYVIAFDSVSEKVLAESKRLGIPIVVIKTKAYTTGIKPYRVFDQERERYL